MVRFVTRGRLSPKSRQIALLFESCRRPRTRQPIRFVFRSIPSRIGQSTPEPGTGTRTSSLLRFVFENESSTNPGFFASRCVPPTNILLVPTRTPRTITYRGLRPTDLNGSPRWKRNFSPSSRRFDVTCSSLRGSSRLEQNTVSIINDNETLANSIEKNV